MGLMPNGTHEWDNYINIEDIERIIHNIKSDSQPSFKTLEKTGVMVSNPLTMEMDEYSSYLRSNYMVMFKHT